MVRRRSRFLGEALAAAVLLLAIPAAADEFTIGAEVMIDTRYFFEPNDFSKSGNDVFFDPSAAIQPTATYVFDSGVDTLRGTLFGRYDPFDSGRTHFDVREAFYHHMGDGWDFLIGANQVFWGVTESRHLVNIVNQLDYVEDVDGEDFLGQPMVALSVFGEWGMLDVYAMPYFRKRRFYETDARFGYPIDVSTDPAYESDMDEWHPDFAARYRITLDNWDFGLSHFYGTSRAPRFQIDLREPYASLPFADQIDGQFVSVEDLDSAEQFLNDNGIDVADGFEFLNDVMKLRPFYNIINQTGLEAVGVYDDLILKFEGATITGYAGDRIWAMVGGFEYTFNDVDGSGIDVGLLSEYLFDNRNFDDAPFTPYDNDLFVGTRITFNDVADTNILFGAYVDLGEGSTILNLEASHRIEDNMKISLVGRGFAYTSENDPLRFYDDNSYVELRLSIFW